MPHAFGYVRLPDYLVFRLDRDVLYVVPAYRIPTDDEVKKKYCNDEDCIVVVVPMRRTVSVRYVMVTKAVLRRLKRINDRLRLISTILSGRKKTALVRAKLAYLWAGLVANHGVAEAREDKVLCYYDPAIMSLDALIRCLESKL